MTDDYGFSDWTTCNATCNGGKRSRSATKVTYTEEIDCHTQDCTEGKSVNMTLDNFFLPYVGFIYGLLIFYNAVEYVKVHNGLWTEKCRVGYFVFLLCWDQSSTHLKINIIHTYMG